MIRIIRQIERIIRIERIIHRIEGASVAFGQPLLFYVLWPSFELTFSYTHRLIASFYIQCLSINLFYKFILLTASFLYLESFSESISTIYGTNNNELQ